MKTVKMLMLPLAFALSFALVSCNGTPQNSSQSPPESMNTPAENATLTSEEINEAEKIVNALSGSLMIGSSWDKIAGDEYKYDLSLTTFYCILNPDHPAEIPAATYESFIQRYFNTSDIDLREMDEYNQENETYVVSEDISLDRAIQQGKAYFSIDSIENIDGQIKVSYHTIWGNMAPDESMENSVVFAGFILLDKEDGYRVLKVELTEDNSNLPSSENTNPESIEFFGDTYLVSEADYSESDADGNIIFVLFHDIGFIGLADGNTSPSYQQVKLGQVIGGATVAEGTSMGFDYINGTWELTESDVRFTGPIELNGALTKTPQGELEMLAPGTLTFAATDSESGFVPFIYGYDNSPELILDGYDPEADYPGLFSEADTVDVKATLDSFRLVKTERATGMSFATLVSIVPSSSKNEVV